MSVVEKSLSYRGRIKGVAGVGGVLAFVTIHPEGRPTGLYRLDADTLTLAHDPLPRGGNVVIADEDESLWIGGDDGQLYRVGTGAGAALKPVGPRFATAPQGLALLAEGRLAVLVDAEIVVLARADGKSLQTLSLLEPGTALAADPTGRWLAAGTAGGTVVVFDVEEKTEFLLSASEKLHEGAVTALLFEPEELRFLSAGADLKLLSTLARGKLEPEDKGKGASHADVITALAWGPGDRLYSGGRDGVLKNWPRTGGARPATLKDGIGKVVALGLVQVHGRFRLVAACDDNTLRVVPLDAAGKFGEVSHRIRDAYGLAASELAQPDARRREAALEELAGFEDAPALELIAERVSDDHDPAVRLLAVRKLAASTHPYAATLLEPCLHDAAEAVRSAAFEGLRTQLGATDLKPLELALKVGKADLGGAAVKALETLARQDDRAFARLLETLNADPAEVRQAALASLETLYGPRSPEASLVALKSRHADVRRLALVRLLQRGLLGEPGVETALRRRTEDDDPEVRRTAFLLSLYTRERLLAALRLRDPELHRQLLELEGAPAEEDDSAAEAQGAKGSAKPKAKPKPKSKAKEPEPEPGPEAPIVLEGGDDAPLLQATVSRALDTSLRGARGLALLGDPRAFGLLLQLSREKDARARVEVCRAMAALDDPRSIERLRSLLHDREAEVRDAAFSALAQLHQAEPLLGAEAGLGSSSEDVRRRGLQLLIAEIRNTPAAGRVDGPALALLARALNDDFDSVRGEAFKAALNLQLVGGGAGTLRFLARSIHPAVRREVLTEVMAQLGEPWAWDLLLEFFNDPDPVIRSEAFEFANKKTKGLEFLEAGLGSRYPDVRRRAVEGLIKKRTAAAQGVLVRALDDEERAVRLAALESLVLADARPRLVAALGNLHADVRLRAARALAAHGDRAVLEPLLALATEPEPLEAERVGEWSQRTASALEGLGELGDPDALTSIIPALDSPHAEIRKRAAEALVWVARPETLGALREALAHADPQVRYRAALGLAYAGEASVAPIVFSTPAAAVLDVDQRLAAAVALGPAGEDQLVVFLDDASAAVRRQALLILMLLEWKAPRAGLARCLACLSSRSAQARLAAARALESLAEPAGLLPFLTRQINIRSDDEPDWTIAEPTLDALAELLTWGTPLVRARTVERLRSLRDPDQAGWDLAWSVHASRFASELAALRAEAKARAAAPPLERRGLLELAFGAYVGLAREQGAATRKKSAPAGDDPKAAGVRRSALSRLLALAQAEPEFSRGAVPVFIQSLGDSNQAVRLQAFEQLQALDCDPARLGAEALAAGYTDLGVKGLKVLSARGAAGEGGAVLEQVMLTRGDELATEAARLLIAERGAVAVAGPALAAAFEPLREQAVAWLAAEYDRDETAGRLLREALESRYQRVRETAALELATKQDAAAFPALTRLLTDACLPVPQQRFIQALVTLGDPRGADALLDRLETDPSGTAAADRLLAAAGGFRRPENVARLLALAERDRKRRDAALAAVLAISGFDQHVPDPDDESLDLDWVEKQYKRHPDVLARLMERAATLGEVRFLGRLVPEARWVRSPVVDPPLTALTVHPDDNLRRSAVEALGWRILKRGSVPEPLLKLLSHPDPMTQFLAAEALAKAGRSEGLNVLLASLDFVSDLSLRSRAVAALGELADERALDTLLRLAGEDGHALQEPAAEAVGHLGRSARADQIFKLLERYAKRDAGLAVNAVKGLRWLDTRAGWQVVRQTAVAGDSYMIRAAALEMLGYNDDPATRDLLLRRIALPRAVDPFPLANVALTSARRLFGVEALEPDYALLRNPDVFDDEIVDKAVRAVSERGEVSRLFELVPQTSREVREPLATRLLGRSPLPLAEAWAALAEPEAPAVELAARVLGRAGALAAEARASGNGNGSALEAALVKWFEAWQESRRKLLRGENDAESTRFTESLTPCLRALVWAAGRLQVAGATLLAMAADPRDDPAYRPIRFEVVAALAAQPASPATDAALRAAALGADPELRDLAASAVGRRGGDGATALAGAFLADRVGFQRLVNQPGVEATATARQAVGQVHAQGVVLPYLVAQADVEGLGAVMDDRSLSSLARLGALEALASLGREEAESRLRTLALAGDEDEELRKAAWRGLRRSKRARNRDRDHAVNAGSEGRS